MSNVRLGCSSRMLYIIGSRFFIFLGTSSGLFLGVVSSIGSAYYSQTPFKQINWRHFEL